MAPIWAAALSAFSAAILSRSWNFYGRPGFRNSEGMEQPRDDVMDRANSRALQFAGTDIPVAISPGWPPLNQE